MDPIEVLLGYAVNRSGADGILTGGHFAAQVSRVIGGCTPADAMADQKGWEDAVRKEAGVLSYTAADLSILHTLQNGPGGTKLVSGQPNPESRKQLDELIGEAEKSEVKPLMVFECIITSTREDRDKDILESKGAEVDPAHPLLWQHIPMQPIGRHLRVTEQTDKLVKGGFAIAPTPLGQDAVTLVEFGALRISHGFLPMEFEPRSKTEGEETPGWRIRRFKVLETSLVSVPSNEDAIILAFSRSKLHHPLVKRWAASLKSLAPPMIVGGWMKEAGGTLPAGGITVNVNLTQGTQPTGGAKESSMDPKEKAAAEAAAKAEADKKAAEAKAAADKKAAEKAAEEKRQAEQKATALYLKRLGKKAASKLKEAHELVTEAAGHAKCPASVRALLKEAAGLVKDVYNSGEEEGKEEEEEEGKEEMADEDKEDEEEEEAKEEEEEEEEKRVSKEDEEEEAKEDEEEEEAKEDEEEEEKPADEGKGKGKKAGKKGKKSQATRTPNQVAGDLLLKLFDADNGPDPAIVEQVIEQGKVYVSAAAAVK